MDRPYFEYSRGGEPVRWEYDVVILHFAFESLEQKHHTTRSATPTPQLLEAIAADLISRGLEGCTADIAATVYRVVTLQYDRLQLQISEMLEAINPSVAGA